MFCNITINLISRKKKMDIEEGGKSTPKESWIMCFLYLHNNTVVKGLQGLTANNIVKGENAETT